MKEHEIEVIKIALEGARPLVEAMIGIGSAARGVILDIDAALKIVAQEKQANPSSDELVNFLRKLSDIELTAVLHEARKVDDTPVANAVLAEFISRLPGENSVNNHDQQAEGGA